MQMILLCSELDTVSTVVKLKISVASAFLLTLIPLCRDYLGLF